MRVEVSTTLGSPSTVPKACVGEYRKRANGNNTHSAVELKKIGGDTSLSD